MISAGDAPKDLIGQYGKTVRRKVRSKDLIGRYRKMACRKALIGRYGRCSIKRALLGPSDLFVLPE